MDASELQVADTATIHVKNANGEPLYDGENPVRIVVHGPGSRAFSTVEARNSVRTARRLNENDGKYAARTPEERRAEMVEDLVTLTVSFEHLTCGDKQGADLFAAVYGDPKLGFIVSQVNKVVDDWGKFSPGSSGS